MSEQIKDGGPAFPGGVNSVYTNIVEGEPTQGGMTLRDYFASKAMHAELVTCGVPGEACNALIAAADEAGRTPEEQIAWNAYEQADAMLRAREVQSIDDDDEDAAEEVARQSMERAHGVIGA